MIGNTGKKKIVNTILANSNVVSCYREVQELHDIVGNLRSSMKTAPFSNMVQHQGAIQTEEFKQQFMLAERYVNDVDSLTKSAKNSIKRISPTVNTIALIESDIYRDLKALEDTFDNVEIEDDVIKVMTPIVKIEHNEKEYEFGPFYMIYNYRYFGSITDSCKPEITTNRGSKRSVNGLIHPHVKGSGPNLCIGDTNVALNAAVKMGDVFGYFTMVYSILRTYNSESPYENIEKWAIDICESCGTRTTSGRKCHSCGRILCGNCTMGITTYVKNVPIPSIVCKACILQRAIMEVDRHMSGTFFSRADTYRCKICGKRVHKYRAPKSGKCRECVTKIKK